MAVLGGGRIRCSGGAAHVVKLEPSFLLNEGVLLAFLALEELTLVLGPVAGKKMLPQRVFSTQQAEHHLHGDSGALANRVLALLHPFAFRHLLSSSFLRFFFLLTFFSS